MTAEMIPAYDDETVYAVKLVRPVVFNRSKFLPLPVHEMTGRVLKAIVEQEGADAIDSADPR